MNRRRHGYGFRSRRPTHALRLRSVGRACETGYWSGYSSRLLVRVPIKTGRQAEDPSLGSGWICSLVQATGIGHFQAAADECGSRSMELRASELAMILDGIDVSKLKRMRRYERTPGTARLEIRLKSSIVAIVSMKVRFAS